MELEETLFDIESFLIDNDDLQISFSDEAFKASIKIFLCVMMDKMWQLQENEGLELEDRLNMAKKAGDELRKFVKTYTNVDTLNI